jgi:hypothetical protein
MRLINTYELKEYKAGDFSPEMLVVGKGHILSAHDWSEEFKMLKRERDEARLHAEAMRQTNGASANDDFIFPWENIEN